MFMYFYGFQTIFIDLKSEEEKCKKRRKRRIAKPRIIKYKYPSSIPRGERITYVHYTTTSATQPWLACGR